MFKGLSAGARASLGVWEDDFGSLDGIKLGELTGMPIKESTSIDDNINKLSSNSSNNSESNSPETPASPVSGRKEFTTASMFI